MENKEKYPNLILTEKDYSFLVTGKNFTITFDKSNGALSSFIWNGKEQIFSPLLPNFTRLLTDNDERGWKPQEILKEWYSPNLKLENITAEQPTIDIIKLTTNYLLIDGKASCQIICTVNSNGELKVDYSLNPSPDLSNIPKVGMQCGIRRSYDQITWYDRKIILTVGGGCCRNLLLTD